MTESSYEVEEMDEAINMEEINSPKKQANYPKPQTNNKWVADMEEHDTSGAQPSTRRAGKTKMKKSSTKHYQSKSLVRDFVKHMKINANEEHSTGRPLSPQLLLRNGKMEVWSPDLKVKIEDNGESNKDFSIRRKGFDFLKWKLLPDSGMYLFQETIRDIEGVFGSGVASVFKFMRWIIMHNMILFLLWFFFILLPGIISCRYEELSGIGYRFENLLEGTGPFAKIWLFYGNYEPSYGSYRVDMAYTILAVLTFFGTLFVLLRSMAKSEKKQIGSPLSLLIFASCKFSIMSQFDRESYRSDVAIHAKDILSEAKTKNEVMAKQREGRAKIFFKRCIAWLLSFGLTAGACFVIYVYMKKITVTEYLESVTSAKFIHDFVKTSGLSVLFCIINVAIPPIIEKLVKMEAYQKVSLEIRVNVIRVFFLRFISIIVLMLSLYSTVTSDTFRGCGGTFIGQEIYKIVVFDILFITILTAALKTAWYLIRKEKKEPNVSSLVLQVVYRQVLVWSGTFFCPIMPLLGIVSQVMLYYTHYFLFKRTCKASAKRFRNDGASTFYKACIAVALSALLVPIITILGSKYVLIGETKYLNGTLCGPFKDKTPLAILNEISSKREKLPDWMFYTLNWLTSAAAFPGILVLSIIVYAQTVRVAKHKKQLKELQIDHDKFKLKSNARLLRATEAV